MKARAVTILFIVLGLIAPAHMIADVRYHDSVTSLQDSVVWLSEGVADAIAQAVEVRLSLSEYRDGQGQGREEAGVTWSDSEDLSVWYSATLSPGNEDAGHIGDFRYMLLAVRRHTPDSVRTIFSKKLTHDISPERGYNSICAEIRHGDGTVEIYCGNHELHPVTSIGMPMTSCRTRMGLFASGKAEISLAVTDCETDIKETHPRTDVSGVLAKLSTTEGCTAEGVWRYLDRENDERFGRPGGLYTLAVTPDAAGELDIVYLDGASVNADQWQPGMIKGKLSPTRFRGNYNMTWYDSMFGQIQSECYAQVDDQGEILTLSFPLLKSQMRFMRCRDK